MSEQPAPFIPGTDEEDAIPEEPWRVFGTGSFFRLWLSQVLSSLGDWIGLLAILALANTVSKSNAAALSLVMVARMLPGFLLAPLCGALVDRLDRKRVMVVTDVARAVLLALLPFVDTLFGLVLASFVLELFALFRGPATAATVPNLVPAENLPQANSLSLVAAFGTFPAGALIFASLAGLADWLSGFNALEFLKLDRESIALYFDALAFGASALITMTLPIPRQHLDGSRERLKVTQTLRDIKEGVQFIARNELVRGVIIGLAGGLLGGGMIIPLGPVFSDRVLHEGNSGFGLLMFALGFGAAIGVISLVLLQKRAPLETVFWVAVVATGGGIMAAASFSALVAAMFVTVFVGAAAGTGYVAGFTLLQRNSYDEVRGRTFAALYTLIRVCLLFSLTVTPLLAGAFDELSTALFDNAVIEVGGQAIGLPGVRLALWLGGSIALASGFVARREMIQAHRREHEREQARERRERVSKVAFIVLEGGDASGKSTQARRLSWRLERTGRTVVETFEPGATEVGRHIRTLLLDGPERIEPMTEALLLAADRAQQITEVIRPALDRGDIVVADRYVPSSLAYQGIGRGLGVEVVEQVNQVATGGLEPDIVIVLDVTDEVAASRRAGPGDRVERAGAEFHAAVRQAYRDLAGERGWTVVDGNGSEDDVAERVWQVVSER